MFSSPTFSEIIFSDLGLQTIFIGWQQICRRPNEFSAIGRARPMFDPVAVDDAKWDALLRDTQDTKRCTDAT